MNNQYYYIRNTIYALKMNYGFPIDLYVFKDSQVNLDTGQKTVTKLKYHIRRAIILPTNIGRSFTYDLSFIAANKNFTYGGNFDKTVKDFVLDTRDFPKGLKLQLEDFIIYNNTRYDFKKFEEFDHKQAVIIRTERVEGEAPQQILDLQASNTTDLRNSSGGEL